MADYCLPPKLTSAFLSALKDGTLTPAKLMDMSSAERRAAFEKVIGEENAKEVNALFESKMLLKDQQAGMITWAKKVAGISEPARRDLIAQIQKLDRVLQPAEEKKFLADLAAQKLGATVTSEEAKEIFDLSRQAEVARQTMVRDLSNVENRIAYGRALMNLRDHVEELKPNVRSFNERLIDALNIPKTALTSILHFSAPFVQGWGMLSTRRAWEAFGQMFRYFADEENYKNLNAYIISHPDYPLAVKAKLGITKLGDKLTAREEAIQSSLIEQANQWLTDKSGIPNLVRASSRSFTGYLNYVRFNRFTDLLAAARLAGEDVSADSSVTRDLAKVVNDFTGRGAIGKDDAYASVVPALNAAFFSPRKLSATMQMFNPVRYLDPRISPTARAAATRQLLGSLIGTGTVLGIAAAMGAGIDVDPRSANFAKIVIGGEKLDMTGGNAIYLRLLGRLITGQSISANGNLMDVGNGFRQVTRADMVIRYVRGKLSPVAGALADAMYGTDPVGRPFSITQELQDKLTPIFIGQMINFLRNDADNVPAYLPALTAIFGVGLESPIAGLDSKFNVWGEPSGTTTQGDRVDATLRHIGVYPGKTERKLRGVTLNDEQYDEYQQLAGRMMKASINKAISPQRFSGLPLGRQEDLVRDAWTKAREHAGSLMLMRHHDLLAAANQAKRDARINGSPTAIKRREGQ